MRIDRFDGGYQYLSNFYEAPVLFEGLHYRNSEAAYQASKSVHPGVRAYFTDLSPDEARKLGRAIPIRPDWLTVRADTMRRVVHAKLRKTRRLPLRWFRPARRNWRRATGGMIISLGIAAARTVPLFPVKTCWAKSLWKSENGCGAAPDTQNNGGT